MLRLRMRGGRITKEKLQFIIDCIRQENIDKVHFTTCQTVQLHNLKPEQVSGLMLKALDCGIITWGGGGDYPRNVMASPLSGVEQGEYFDVMPYVQAAEDYLLGFIDNIKLPRKLKVGFSNSPANEAHVTFRDLGFAARIDGDFDVYSAGGLGNNPRMGVLVAEKVEPSKILYYIKAMLDTFVAYGDYENRGKARTRYMVDKLGVDGYRQAYTEKLQTVMEQEPGLELNIEPEDIHKTGSGESVEHNRIICQKQPGLFAVSYHPLGGIPEISALEKLNAVITGMEQVELRLTPNQGLYIINCTHDEAELVWAATEGGGENTFEHSVACIGSSVCQVGVRDSQKLLNTLVKEMRACGFEDGVLPVIHISGCPSSCGTHQIGQIGFHGGVKMIEKTAHPAFTLHVNGKDEQSEEQFGKQLGVILEADIPAFLKEVGELVQSAQTTYQNWISNHEEDLERTAAKYLK